MDKIHYNHLIKQTKILFKKNSTRKLEVEIKEQHFHPFILLHIILFFTVGIHYILAKMFVLLPKLF